MIKATAYELRKNYLTRLVIITFISLILINLIYIYYDYQSIDYKYNYFLNQSHDKDYIDFVENMYKKLEGKITLKKVQFITNEYNRLEKIVSNQTYSTEYQEDTYTGYIFGDFTAIKTYFYNPLKYTTMYKNDMNNLITKSEENIYFYELYKNKFKKEENQFIANHYKERKIDYFYETKPWEKLFDYRFSDFLIICFVIFVVVPIFIQEKETKMGTLILSCTKGKITMGIAKISSLFVFISFVIIVISFINFISFYVLYGLTGLNLPIYAVQNFKYTPLNCSIIGFFVIFIFMKFLGIFSFALSALLFSLIFQNIIYSYTLSIFYAIMTLYFSGFLISVENIKTFISFISPLTLLQGQKLYGSLLGCNIINKFVLRANVCILVQSVFIIFLIVIICFLGTKMNIARNCKYLKKRCD